MPGYVEKGLKDFRHEKPQYCQDQPHPCAPPKYVATKQYAQVPNNSLLLDKAEKKFVQQVIGKILYLGQAVNSTITKVLSSITY